MNILWNSRGDTSVMEVGTRIVYVLTRTQQQREALKLEMPETLRQKINAR